MRWVISLLALCVCTAVHFYFGPRAVVILPLLMFIVLKATKNSYHIERK